MRTADFDYDLSEELIAQFPPEQRGCSRMLVLDRGTGDCELRSVAEFATFLRPGDCLVLNDTRVIPARLFGRRQPSGGRVEILLVENAGNGEWTCFLRPARRLNIGERIALEGVQETVRIVDKGDGGEGRVAFDCDDPHAVIARAGHMPLPPYIRRDDADADRERYQTVYAERLGAVAAPTAGLHFTPAMLEEAEARGVRLARVTLHVGPGTFRPVQTDNLDEHVMHEEAYELTPETAETLNATRANGGRIVAVGTTCVRVLETCANSATGTVEPGTGRTRLFLHPPKKPRTVDALLTNFHLPRSTLLMLVCTFADREHVLAAYQTAVENRFRFYSYGDCMFLQ